MQPVRMSLAEAAEMLGIATNSVRSRFKAGKLPGERDNSGKLWVWIDPDSSDAEGSRKRRSKASTEVPKDDNRREIDAMEAHIVTLTEQLAAAMAELAVLRPRASEADRLAAETAGLEAQRETLQDFVDEMKVQGEFWQGQVLQQLRQIAETNRLLDQGRAAPEVQRSWIRRLVG